MLLLCFVVVGLRCSGDGVSQVVFVDAGFVEGVGFDGGMAVCVDMS